MSQLSAPPKEARTVGQRLDARLDHDRDAIAILIDRLGQIGVTVAQQALDLADFQQALASLQRRVGRYP